MTTIPKIEQTTWRIDPERSSVEFKAKGAWGLAPVRGRFTRFHGTLDLSATPAAELTVEADSLDTRSRRRDAHLRSPDFFDAERHPYVRFVSESATLGGEQLRLRGSLHARCASVPLEVDATVRGDGDELEIEAVTAADHKALGMTWNLLGMIRTPTTLTLKGRLVR